MTKPESDFKIPVEYLSPYKSLEEVLKLDADQRAIVAARACERSKKRTRELQTKKTAWIRKARAPFLNFHAPPKDCYVCDKYRIVAQEHHELPLALQHDLGMQEADLSTVWLCPSHHALIHHQILVLLESRTMPDYRLGSSEAKKIHELIMRFVRKYSENLGHEHI